MDCTFTFALPPPHTRSAWVHAFCFGYTTTTLVSLSLFWFVVACLAWFARTRAVTFARADLWFLVAFCGLRIRHTHLHTLYARLLYGYTALLPHTDQFATYGLVTGYITLRALPHRARTFPGCPVGCIALPARISLVALLDLSVAPAALPYMPYLYLRYTLLPPVGYARLRLRTLRTRHRAHSCPVCCLYLCSAPRFVLGPHVRYRLLHYLHWITFYVATAACPVCRIALRVYLLDCLIARIAARFYALLRTVVVWITLRSRLVVAFHHALPLPRWPVLPATLRWLLVPHAPHALPDSRLYTFYVTVTRTRCC